MKYEQTIGELKAAVSKKAGVGVADLQLFWHGKELTPSYDARTLIDLSLHTGFSLMGYDLRVAPAYWPPVRPTPEGLQVVPAGEDA